ncbi:Uncharacterised protein [Vibrio cholerae]|nr:Uncharacterised protein [Vibrio cholerae]CSI41255.1 Uncharacterised protein [Vibrio cholerae]
MFATLCKCHVRTTHIGEADFLFTRTLQLLAQSIHAGAHFVLLE